MTDKFGEPLLKLPDYPAEFECCDSGCGEFCVYEIYRQQKQAYDEQQVRLHKFLAEDDMNA